MEIQAVPVARDRQDNAGQGGRVGGDLLKHLLEGLPCGFAEEAEFPGAVSEDWAQKFWDGEDELGVTDLFEDVSVEPLGEKQDALLLARKESWFIPVFLSWNSVGSRESTSILYWSHLRKFWPWMPA